MYNWAHTVLLCNKSQILRPKNEEDIIQILHNLLPHQKLKVHGSGMSCLGIGAVENLSKNTSEGDILLDLSCFSGLVSINDHSATFYASTTLQVISDTLIGYRRQISACAGVLLTQTLAGAIATGTHGQGLRNGGLYDAALKIRVVEADCSVKEYSKNQDPKFPAFQLHLGCLGILTEITIATEPLIIYRLTKCITTYEDLLLNYVKWNEESTHCKAWWFPTTDHVQLWRSTQGTDIEEDYYWKNHGVLVPITNNKTDTKFLSTLDSLIEKMDEDTKKNEDDRNDTQVIKEVDPFNEHNARFRTVTRFRSLENYLGNVYQLWCKGIPAPQINCEIGIPLNQFEKAMDALKQYSSERTLHYPFILRTTGESDAWLSPSYKQPIIYIGFLVYLSEDTYTPKIESLEILKEVEVILSKFDGRPHYGKYFNQHLYQFERLIPKWSDFCKLRSQVDPNGIFLNGYLKNLLGLKFRDGSEHHIELNEINAERMKENQNPVEETTKNEINHQLKWNDIHLASKL